MLHGKEKMLPRVVAVEAEPDYSIIVTFNNGEIKKYDLKQLFDVPMYKTLPGIYKAARVEYGTVVWPGDIDISPDTLYLRGVSLS